MKLLLTLLIVATSCLTFAQGPQAWPEAFNQDDVNTIKAEIATPMSTGDVDAVLSRMVFPFRVGEEKYSKAELKTKFSEFFTPDMCAELANSDNYEVMNPDGDNYMMVCRNSPEGYDGAVPVFERIEGVWMLVNLDLYE